MEPQLQLEIWRGNVAGAVQIARQRNELSDWIVAMAPLASSDLWELVSLEYADQLERDGQYHKAVTYLLAAGKVHQAIDLFRRHRLFADAVSLARVRLSLMDPLLEDLFTEWGQSLMKEGQFEEAAKCYLAMRHIQEAVKAQTWHREQLPWKMPNPSTCQPSENSAELVQAYRLLTQHLVLGEWQEAYIFVEKHASLKVLLPFLSTHELLVEQLTALNISLSLTQKPVTSDMFSHWEKKQAANSRTELPDYLLDKSETDPVVPWEPYLVGKHTFPHHVLIVWYKHLNVTMVTQELRTLYRCICQLSAKREATSDLPSILVTVSMDMTLCLLTLLMSETARAISHFLQAIYTLHQAHQAHLLQAICRLTLPQGPKYLLKLQQEFNASRVLITMESHGDISKAGGENHNTIKKFLTDIKDDSSISMSSSRCRDLDCLRAYYYLAILEYLKDKLKASHHENDSHDGMPGGSEALENLSGTEFSHGQDNLIIGGNRGNNTSHQQSMMMSYSNSSRVNTQRTKSPHEVNNSRWNLPRDCQNGQFFMSHSSLVTSQSHNQTGTSSVDSCVAIHASKPKGSDEQLTQKSNPDISITADSQTLSRLLPDLNLTLEKSFSGFSSPVSKISMTANEYSSLDSFFGSSKLPFLKKSPLKSSICYHSTSSLKSFLSPSLGIKSSPSPSNSPLSLSPSSDSPSSVSSPLMSSPSVSPASSLTWPVNSLLSLYVSSNSPSSLSPSNSPLCSPMKRKTNSPKNIKRCVNMPLSDMNKSPFRQQQVSKEHLNYGNLLRLSKGILWDAQAKREALTETLGYIHYAISQHLLSETSGIRNHQNCTKNQSAKDTSSSLHRYMNSEIAEDGGFNTCLLSPSLTTLPEAESESFRKTTFDTKFESSFQLSSSSDSEPAKVSSFKMPVHDESDFQGLTVLNITGNYLPYKITTEPSARLELPIPLKAEHLLGHQLNEAITFQKSKKVLWMDVKEACNSVGQDICKSAWQVSRLAPDGTVIPLEWDELPVDIKYTMPYVTLALLRQEQETISQELKRVPDVSKVPFPSMRTGVKSLLLASLTSADISVQEKLLYYQQLCDWATLFAVTSDERQETETMFQAALMEYLPNS